MGRILSFLIPLLLCLPAYGEPLVHYIGWSMTKIEQEAPVEDGTYTTRPDFYALKPPGDRPAITVDARTASALRAGQADPETIYSRSAKTGGEPESSDEEFVYGASNSQIVQADPVESTLPSDQRSRDSGASQVITASSASQADSSEDGPGFSNVISAPFLPRPASSPGFTPTRPSGGNAPGSAPSTAASVLPETPVNSTPAAGRPLPVRPGLPDTAADRELASAMAEAQGAKVPGLAAGKAAEGNKVAEVSGPGGGRVTANQQAQGFGFGSGAKVSQNKSPEERREEPPPPCVPGKKIFEKPGLERIDLPPGCNLVYVTAWGAGGGNGGGSGTVGGRFYGGEDGSYQSYEARPGVGGAGAFVNVTGKVDARRYDLIIAVGAAGASAKGSEAGLGGFPGGGTGGASSHAAGGGGGGYSGAFLIDKTNKTKATKPENAIAVAAGGGGGGGRGGNGAPGRVDGAGGKSGNGEAGGKLLGGHGGEGLPYPGCENSQQRCMVHDNSGEGYSSYEVARDHLSAGGGGGGGGLDGGGGGAGARSGGNTAGGGGGSSLAKLENQITEAGEGTKAGFYHYPSRGNAGNAGQHGKVIVEYY